MNDAHLNYFYSFIFYILLLFQNFSHNEDEIHLLNIIVDYFLQDEDILVFFCTFIYVYPYLNSLTHLVQYFLKDFLNFQTHSCIQSY